MSKDRQSPVKPASAGTKATPSGLTVTGPVPKISDHPPFSAAVKRLAGLRNELAAAERELAASVSADGSANMASIIDGQAEALVRGEPVDMSAALKADERVRGLRILIDARKLAVTKAADSLQKIRSEWCSLHARTFGPVLQESLIAQAERLCEAAQLAADEESLRDRLQAEGIESFVPFDRFIGTANILDPSGGGWLGAWLTRLAEIGILDGREEFLRKPALRNVVQHVRAAAERLAGIRDHAGNLKA